ncbi:MAG: hypothetical protein NTZ05_17810 [Chloroflexi bacterium]|nr:hypothetical protein [Chloroflexota bacterium]
MVQQARVDQHTLYFTPTLVIGLGGTGQRVVRRLKQKVASTFGVTSAEDYPLIRFLVIDTDNSDDPANEVSLSDRERVILHGYNPAQQLRDIDMPGREPLKRRLPVSISRSQQVIELMNMHVTHGARQNRLVSLIGLFAQFEKVRAEMVGAIDSVLSMARGINVGNVYLNGFQARSIPPTEGGFPFRVIIICSLGGGTGSGLFLDIAYLCKHFLRNQLPQMHGVLVLPPVLDLAVERTSWTQRQRIRANTYAALKEIDMLGDRGRWTYDYPLGISVDESGGPVDYC